MTKVTFETGTLADSIKKASSIAPTRGGNLSEMAGVIIKVIPASENPITVMATDGNTFYMESVSALSVEGSAASWRLPSKVLEAVLVNLPLGSGHQAVLTDEIEEGRVMVTSGKVKVKLANLSVNTYPVWEPFQVDSTNTVPNLGRVINRVRWAAGDRSGAVRSVFILPDCIYSTDRFKIARVSTMTGLEEKECVVVPSDQLGKVLPRDTDIKMANSGTMFIVMPDDYTQVATTTLTDAPMPVGKILDADYKYETHCNKQHLVAALTRALAFDSADRQSLIKLVFGKGEIALVTTDQEVGMFGEQVAATGAAEGDSYMRLQVGPNQLREAIQGIQSSTIKMFYNDLDSKPKVLVFRDGDYSCALALSHRDEKKEEQ